MNLTIAEIIPITLYEIQRVERITKLKLSDSFKNFILKNNGGIPTIDGETCLFNIKVDDTWTTSTFLENFTSMNEVIEQWEFIGYLAQFAEHFELDENYVETNELFPVANFSNGVVYIAVGGNHVGKIYTADNGDFGIIYHSPTLDDFLMSLYSEK